MFKEYGQVMVNSDSKGITITDGEKTVDINYGAWRQIVKDFGNAGR